MKKLLLIGMVALSLTAFTQLKSVENTKTDSVECQNGRCIKIKSDGYQCNNCAQTGSAYCWSHSLR